MNAEKQKLLTAIEDIESRLVEVKGILFDSQISVAMMTDLARKLSLDLVNKKYDLEKMEEMDNHDFGLSVEEVEVELKKAGVTLLSAAHPMNTPSVDQDKVMEELLNVSKGKA